MVQIESYTVISDSEFYFVAGYPSQGKAHKVCLAVFGYIVKGFLCDTEYGNLQRLRQIMVLYVDLFFDSNPRMCRLKILGSERGTVMKI